MVEHDGLPLPQRRVAIVATALGTFMSMMDSTIANVALPTIARDLGASASSAIWIVNAYQFAIVIMIVPLASLGDIVGYARIYRIGLAIFIAASLVCALSHTLVALACARVLQGMGAAAMTASIGSLNRNAYPKAMLGRSTGQGALVVALGAAAGPVVGGSVLSVAPWPWLFLINIPIGIVAFALALRSLPETKGSGLRFDLPSAVMSGASFGLLIATISSMGHHERPWLVAAEAVATLVIGTIFVRRQWALPIPLFGVDLFLKPVFSLSIVASVTSFMSQTVAYVALPFLFQNVLDLTPFATGLLMVPWLAAAAVMAPIAGRFSDRFEPGIMGGIGMVIMGAGLFTLVVLPTHASTLDIVWRMGLCGFGYGFFQSPNNRTILGSVERKRTGAAQGILATARVTGQTLGAAVVALMFGATLEKYAGAASHGAITEALEIAVAFAVIAGIASAFRRDVRARVPA